MKTLRWLSCFAVVLAFGSASLRAGDAEADWKEIIALDAGPQEQPQTAEAARAMVTAHVAKQERALRGFLTAHPQDPRVFETRLRLARLLQIRGDIEQSDKQRAEGKRQLDELEKTATPEQRVELDFAKVSRLMRNLRQVTPARRDELLAAARKFQADHPGDRRIAALLAEVATLFDAQPKTKEALLTEAQPLVFTSVPSRRTRLRSSAMRPFKSSSVASGCASASSASLVFDSVSKSVATSASSAAMRRSPE